MAKTEEIKKADTKNGGPAATAAPVDDYSDLQRAAPEGGVEVGESYLYRPGDQPLPGVFSQERDKQGRLMNGVQAGKSHCGWLPIQGWMVQTHHRPAKGEMKAYEQIEFLLTAPGAAIDGDKIRRCKVGDFVLVKASGNLKKLVDTANDPKVLTEMYLCPTGEFIEMKDADRLPMRAWKKVVIRQIERSLVKVPRLSSGSAREDDGDDDFDPKKLTAARPELRA